MKVYVDENDIKRNIVTYCNGTNTQQGLYVFGKDKIEVLSLADYTKQVRKEVCEEIREWHDEECESLDLDSDFDVGYSGALSNLWGILDQIEGETKNAETK